tara:strand:+ start:8418 stop:9158 length:741 start_codon:yes stop_codon:yes gene_type:complete
MNVTTDPTFQLLIDADIIYHRAAFSCEDTYDFGDEAIRTVDDNDVIELFDGMLLGIFGLLKPASYICCWSDSRTFRHDIFPSYKANRTNVRRPVCIPEVKQHLIKKHPSILVSNLEADDIMGMLSSHNTIICSDDKDLLTVPGLHFKPRKKELGVFRVCEYEADRLHLKQTLMGDSVDGFKGIPGVGDKKSDKILDADGVTWDTVRRAYAKANMTEDDALLMARLARILRPGEYDFVNQAPKLWTP